MNKLAPARLAERRIVQISNGVALADDGTVWQLKQSRWQDGSVCESWWDQLPTLPAPRHEESHE